MDWEKAKKIVIIFLILVNVGLYGFNRIRNSTYHVSQAQEKAIYTVLGNNGISLYTEIIKKAYPMRAMNVKAKEITTDELKSEFFKNQEVNIFSEFDRTILRSDKADLMLQNNYIYYETSAGNTQGQKYQNLAADGANNIVTNYVEGITFFAEYKPDNVLKEDDGYIVEFIKEYDGFKLFNSKARFFVTESGIMWFEASFYEQETLTGEKHNICKPDEALLTFMHQAKELGIEQVYINEMDLGYDFTERLDIAEGRQLKLYPSYRIYTSYSVEPFVINAYTNEIKSNVQ